MSTKEQIFGEIRHLWRHQAGDVIDANQIELRMADNIVVLRGTVRTPPAKYIAGDLALATSGVKDVYNYLKVGPPPKSAPGKDVQEENRAIDPEDYRRETGIESDYPGYDPWLDQYSAPELTYSEYATQFANSTSPAGVDAGDEDLMAEIQQRLRQENGLQDAVIKIAVNSGQVILRGTVNSSQSRERIAEVVGSVAGVSHVLNQLRIEPEA